MLTDQDIKKLSSVVATKSDIKEVRKEVDTKFKSLQAEMDRGFGLMAKKSDVDELKKDVDGLRESVQNLVVAVDALTKVIFDLRLEYVAMKLQLNRHEEWIKQIAKKAKVSLKI